MIERRVDTRREIEMNECRETILQALSEYRKQSPRAALCTEAFILTKFLGLTRTEVGLLQGCRRSETISRRVADVARYLRQKPELQDFRD